MRSIGILSLFAFAFALNASQVDAQNHRELRQWSQAHQRLLMKQSAFMGELTEETWDHSKDEVALVRRTSRYEWWRCGGLVKSRRQSTVTKTLGTKSDKATQETVVEDGRYRWALKTTNGAPLVVKNVSDRPDPRGELAVELAGMTAVKVGDIKWAGRDCVYYEGHRYGGARDQKIVLRRCWIDKATGLTMKIEVLNESGKLVRRRSIQGLKDLAKPDVARFQFKPDFGVEVIDKTRPQPASAAVLAKKSSVKKRASRTTVTKSRRPNKRTRKTATPKRGRSKPASRPTRTLGGISDLRGDALPIGQGPKKKSKRGGSGGGAGRGIQ